MQVDFAEICSVYSSVFVVNWGRSLRFVSILLLATYGVLSVAGHGGLHALTSDHSACCGGILQGCCLDGSDKHCSDGSCLHGDQTADYCPWGHGDSRTAEGTPAADATSNRDPGDTQGSRRPLHNPQNCRICEWYTGAQAVQPQQLQISDELAVEFRLALTDGSAGYSSPITVQARGPPIG